MTMTQDKRIQFLKRWRDLARTRQNLDYNEALLFKDWRSNFKNDETFINEIVNELGMTAAQAHKCLQKARLVAVITDMKDWPTGKGDTAWEQLLPILELQRPQQVAALNQAHAQNYQIPTVLRQYRANLDARAAGNSPVSPPRGATPITSASSYRSVGSTSTASALSKEPTVTPNPATASEDATELARYILKNCKDIPRNILGIANRYLSGSVSKRGAGGNLRAVASKMK